MAVDGRYRANIYHGLEVDVVLKRDQRTGKTTHGIVREGSYEIASI
ncbi:DUF2196 domain-containing protein [Virgibacillus sp. NKC19-3]|nr:DUF2196 domain-containing protein [Virgibacillus sp. NKC19-3]MBY7144183.1 DUF2196 domain-containing protein [Virgibacillus sp. NKC19-3]